MRTRSHLFCCAFDEMALHTACKPQGLHLSFEKPLNNKLQPIPS